VKGKAVHLDDNSCFPPEEVDLVAADADIDLGGWELRGLD
jgi:hypothetical protein